MIAKSTDLVNKKNQKAWPLSNVELTISPLLIEKEKRRDKRDNVKKKKILDLLTLRKACLRSLYFPSLSLSSPLLYMYIFATSSCASWTSS